MQVIIRLFIILLSLHTSSVAFSETLVHEATGVAFPDVLAGFSRAGYHEYGTPELGVAYEYRAENGDVATVYLYNAGIPDIPNDVTHSVVDQHHDQVVSDIFQYAATKGKTVEHIFKDVTLEIPGNGDEIAVLFDAFIIRVPAKYTELWLWPARGCFFKIRMTPGQSSDFDGEQRRAFCEAVVRLSEAQ